MFKALSSKFSLGLCVSAAILVSGGVPYAYGDVLDKEIGKGVSAGGIDLSGLTVRAAANRLEQSLQAKLERPLVVRTAGRRFELRASQSGFRFDSLLTAKRAYYASDRSSNGSTEPNGGAAFGKEVGLATSYSRAAVRSFSQTVANGVYRPARNAKLKITVRRMIRRKARTGRTLKVAALSRRIESALAPRSRTRLVRMPVRKLKAKVNVLDLARLYPTVVTVDRANFKLRLFKRLRLRKTYGVAVGQVGLSTPAGRYRIRNKQIDPAWHVPNSSWAGSLAGQVIPGGTANNPLKARWLGIAGGVGIHGTAEEWSIGSRASHGCIRMRVSDVKDLYPRVPVGTAVLIR